MMQHEQKVYKYVINSDDLITMLHSPTLDTVTMVEGVIRKAKEVVSVAEVKRRLPRQVNHNTLKVILAYLQRSGKIEFTPNGVVWVFAPREELLALLSRGRVWS